MRVLHVITGLGVGGAEHQLRLLLRRLEHDCEVVTLVNPGPVAAAIRADGTPVHELNMRGNRDLAAIQALAALIRRGRFDVVHTHLYRACVYGRIAARMAGVRTVVATEHSLGDGVIEGRRTTAAVRALYLGTERLGRATIAVSETVRRRLVAWGVPDNRIAVIPNGIDAASMSFDPALRRAARTRLGIPADARVVGGVGRLVPTKRFDELIRAVAGLPEVTLLLVGDGPERDGLARLVRELGIGDRVVFAGAVPHVREALCAMDVFASPSEQETFGMAIIEALACGLTALYVSCPPLQDGTGAVSRVDAAIVGPTGDAPAAHRVPPGSAALREALRAEPGIAGSGGYRVARQPVAEIVARHDMARLAGAVGQFYERLAWPARTRITDPRLWSEAA